MLQQQNILKKVQKVIKTICCCLNYWHNYFNHITYEHAHYVSWSNIY